MANANSIITSNHIHVSDNSAEGVAIEQEQDLILVTNVGDSMGDTIRDGDPVLVDPRVNEIQGDGVYFLKTTQDDWYGLKRVRCRPGGFSLISDNPKCPDLEVGYADMRSYQVLGRAVQAWNAKTL